MSNSSGGNTTPTSTPPLLPYDEEVEDAKTFDLRKTIPTEMVSPGLEMIRVTRRKKMKRQFRLDLDQYRLYWKPSRFLEIEKIKNIRVGEEAKNYREEFKVSKDYEPQWITIIYFTYSKSNNIKALHIIAPSRADYDLFVSTLKDLVNFRKQLNTSLYSATDNNLFTKFHWDNKPANADMLTFDGVLKMAAKLHISLEQDSLYQIFQDNDHGAKGYLTFEEFRQFVKSLRQRKEFAQIFADHSLEGHMNRTQFVDFLTTTQKESTKTAQKMFEQFSRKKEYLDLDDFGRYLVGPYTAAFKMIREDLSRPLNEYYISSSHNTYLLGRQFNGISSIEGYIRALQRGCRCIEVDTWDGDNGPVVTHGRTFTGSVDFRLVIETIRKYSFITSPFPVIISLEVRCNLSNQFIALAILKEVLGDLLVTSAVSDTLPSPIQLKHRILLKVKKSRGSSIEDNDSSSSMFSSYSEDSAAVKTKILPERKQVPIIPELSALAVYTSGLKFRNFSLPESKTFNHCFSFSDRALIKMLKEPAKFNAVMKHDRNYLMRVYPSVYRIMSDNFNPLIFWSLGVQMPATNWQVYDAGQQINEALFSIGSSSGYILKPNSLRVDKNQFRKAEDFQNTLKAGELHQFKVHVVSAQQLPRPKEVKDGSSIDPFVEMELYSGRVVEANSRYGEMADGVSGLQIKVNHEHNSTSFNGQQQLVDLATPSVVLQTSVVPKNGFNPVWDETFTVKYYTDKNDLVFLRIILKGMTADHTEVIIGYHCCKLSYLRKGYRHLPLYDRQGEEYIYSSLFLDIDYD